MDPELGRQSSNSGESTPALREPERAKLRPRSLRRLRPFAPFVALVVLSLLVGALNPRFFEFNNAVRIANSAAIPLVLALGETFVIILGSVDLSVEGVLALGAVVISILVHNDMNQNAFGWFAPLFSIAAGASIGFLNGVIHVKARIPSFMVTLGSWFVGIGLATLILGGTNARVLDPQIRGLALTRVLDFPLAVWVAVAILVLAWLIERFTVFV